MPLIGSLGAAASRGFGQFLQKITAVLNTDAFFKYVTLLLTGNPPVSTFVTDASTNNLQVTINGDTKPSGFSPNENGYYSFYAATNNDYFIYNDQGAGNFNTGDFTVEFFGFNVNQTTNWIMAGSTANNWQVVNYQNGFYWQENGGNLGGMGFTVPNNQWVHYAISRTGGLLNVYINGTRRYSATNTYNYSAVGNRIIGQASGGVSDKVWMSNLRIIRGTGIYSGTSITVPTSPLTVVANTQLLTCQSNRMIDSAGIQQFTSAGSPQIVGFQPFTPNPSFATYGSTYFDGSGDYLTVPSNNALNFSTGDFTVEAWVNPLALSGDFFIISATGSGGFFVGYSSSTTLGWGWGRNAVSWDYRVASTATANTWQHLAITRSGSSMQLFVNGVQQGTTQTISIAYDLSLTSTTIGSQGATYYLNGYLSNLRVVKGTALYTANFTPPTTPLTAVTNTSLLTCQTNQPVNNNVFLDSSSNNFAITRAGNTTQGSLNPYGGNWSNYFDGSGDYLNCSASSAQFGTGDFTIECWVYPTSLAAIQVIVDFRTTSTAIFGQIYLATNGTVHFYLPTDIATTNTVTLNAWNHIAISRSAGTLKMFINGTSGYSAANSGTYNAVGTYIGISISNTNGFTGYISNMRFITGTGIYTSNFTPSTTPLTAVSGTSLLTCQSNRLIDNSNNNFTITKTNDVSVQRFSPFAPVIQTPTSYSNYFDGTNNLNVPNNSAFAYGTGDFTIEAWVYHTNSGSYAGYSYGGSSGLVLRRTNSNTLEISQDGVASIAISSGTIASNQWVHVAGTRSGSTVRLFINGVLNATATYSGNFSPTTNGTIGSIINVAGYYMTGYISNLRIVKGTALYTATFTPPTSPLTAVSGTSLLTCQSSTIIDNSTNNFAITATGNVSPRTQNPFGVTNNTDAPYTPATYGGSMYFDGTNDYLIAQLGVNSALGNTCTVELWYYPRTSPPTARLINNSTAAGSSLDVYDLDSKIGFANQVATTTTVPLNAWTHIAFVVTSGTLKIYFNGVSQPLSGTSTGINITATGDTWIGGINGYSQWTNGYMSNIRLVKGTALYTANFAPPVAPLQAVTNTTLLLLGSNGAVYDSAMLNNAETLGDAKTSTAVSKFGNSSLVFDGSGDYLDLPASTNVRQTGSWTLEMWMYRTSAVNCYVYSQVTTNFLQIAISPANYILIDRSGVGNAITSTNPMSLNTWTHIALVSDSVNLKLFVDGVQSGSTVSVGTQVQGTTTPTRIGAYQGTGTLGFIGYIDDLRITTGYARYTQNFTVPTQPFPVQ